MKMDVYEINNASSSSSSSIGYLSDSVSVSSDMVEEEHVDGDDEATSSCPSSSNDNMFELSDLMSQLPIKRGLSKYYNGKSDSFKNLIAVKSLEDVPKNRSDRTTLCKMNKQNKNNKQHNHKYSFTTPKSKISKTSNNKGSLKASILMKAWNGTTTTSGLNNSSGTRFIHV